MALNAERWIKQAEADLKAARTSLGGGSFEWACFQSQQAAEKALKALIYSKGLTSIMTHSIKQLVHECIQLGFSMDAHRKAAKRLDTFYIPTRYPNGLASDQAPADYYDREDAEQCISFAQSILDDAKKFFAQ